jgi:hypothetical protein
MSTQPVTGSFVEKLCQTAPSYRNLMSGFKIIDIRTAAEQFYSSTEPPQSDDYYDLFDTVKPPFDRCIFEFRGGDREFQNGETSFEIEDIAVLVESVAIGLEDKTTLSKGYPGNDVVWAIRMRWVYASGREIHFPPADFACFLNSDGRLFRAASGKLVAFGAREENLFSDSNRELISFGVHPVLFALTLIHCKNVHLATVTAPLSLSMKKSKRRKQIEVRKRYPPFERHVVIIRDKKGQIVQRGLGPQLAASHKRMHLVRGHFSTYTDTAPLFGRIVGRFWIPAHLSGLASEGVIDSDYRLEA